MFHVPIFLAVGLFYYCKKVNKTLIVQGMNSKEVKQRQIGQKKGRLIHIRQGTWRWRHWVRLARNTDAREKIETNTNAGKKVRKNSNPGKRV